MSSQHQRLPEPDLPECELIRAADSLPELSSGLRSATLAVCGIHVRRAQRIRRLKIASASLIAASIGFAAWSLLSGTGDEPAAPVAEDHTVPRSGQSWASPSENTGGTETGSVISFGNPGMPGQAREKEDTDRRIEQMHQRTQDLMDAGIVPGF